MKLLVGRRDLLALRNQAFIYTGDTLDSYLTDYTEDEWCLSHDRYEPLEPWPHDGRRGAGRTGRGGGETASASSRPWSSRRRCCWPGTAAAAAGPTKRSGPSRAWAAATANAPTAAGMLSIEAAKSFKPDDPLLALPLPAIHLPDLDVVTLRSEQGRRHFVIRGAS